MTVMTFEPDKPNVSLSNSARIFLSQKIETKQAIGLCFSVKKVAVMVSGTCWILLTKQAQKRI